MLGALVIPIAPQRNFSDESFSPTMLDRFPPERD
jgi:hypothetical protein